MQRWLFFLTLLPFWLWSQGGAIDIRKTEISYWLAGPGSNSKEGLINARAVLSFTAAQSATSVQMLAGGCQVATVRKREGRDKEQLTFTRKEGTLTVDLMVKAGKKYQLVVNYTLDLSRPSFQNFVLNTPSLLAFNSFNTQPNIRAGRLGYFYPAVKGDASLVLLDITIPKRKNIGFPGELEFRVTEDNLWESQYWKSTDELSPEGFYLIIGEFEEFEAEEMEEEFKLGEIALKNVRSNRVQSQLTEAVQFLKMDPDSITDSAYVHIDSIARLGLTKFYLDTVGNLTTDPEVLGLEKAAFVTYQPKAYNQYFLDYYTKKQGAEWLKDLLKGQYEKQAFHPFFWQQYLRLFLGQADENLSLADTSRLGPNSGNSSEALALLSMAREVYSTQKPLEATIDYRYQSSAGTFYFYLSQADTLVNYSLPLAVNVVTSGDQIKTNEIARFGEKDTIIIPLSESPKSALASFPYEIAPIKLNNNRPETYYLYDLANAESQEVKQQALIALFKTKNQNLFSTVLGIAMRDNSEQIRLMALQNARELNAPAQNKLRDEIYRLTQDSSADVRNLANQLVAKYYADK